MNRIRKRFSRWGGGRLAAALAPARVRVFVVSDVIGDDLASIGSGPCVADPATAAEIRTASGGRRALDPVPGAGPSHSSPPRKRGKRGDAEAGGPSFRAGDPG